MLNSGLPAGHKALKAEMPVEEITAYSDRLAHRERRKDSANTEPFNVPSPKKVSAAVTARQVTSNAILIFG